MAKTHGNSPRYGIYYSPRRECPLFSLGSLWLGRDAASGQGLDPGLSNGLGRDEWMRSTASPRRYGFHATLKPPFRLADGTTFDDLRSAVRSLAANTPSFEAPPLQVDKLGHFLALTLSEPSQDFSRFADACVTEFDRFRAPATEQERALRLHDSLTPREREHVHRWGYPYVFDTWKFHMSLTGSLPTESLLHLERILSRRFASVCGCPFVVDSVCIFHEMSPGTPFHLIERVNLRSQ
jgi:putative phosphonate metabolism protein